MKDGSKSVEVIERKLLAKPGVTEFLGQWLTTAGSVEWKKMSGEERLDTAVAKGVWARLSPKAAALLPVLLVHGESGKVEIQSKTLLELSGLRRRGALDDAITELMMFRLISSYKVYQQTVIFEF